ncbi:MAG TPA: tetratricopeptide repeat protein [Tepidisphaeraceae bacterium]|nr:tetratricopeptide repeat protein [Tepidisphaeraceae bacterium]
MPEDLINMYDASGRQVQIPRKQWVEEVLPENIRRAWDDPQALYAVLIGALNEKMGPAVMDAIKHLAEIDPDRQRPVVLEGIALVQDKKLDEAEKLFQSYMDAQGATASILTNLARIYWERNQRAQAEATLRRALSLDANLEAALMWYLSLQRQRGGEQAEQAAIRQFAQDPKNWRAKLMIAARLLKSKKADEGLALYREILSQGQLPPEALVHITGDLGGSGRLQEMVQWVLPVYSLQLHGPYAGLNLLQGLISLGRVDQARTLIGELQELNHPALAPVLNQMSARLAKSASTAPAAGEAGGKASVKVEPDESQLAAVPLLNPIWTAALSKPDWILPPLRTDAVKLAIFSLADMTPDASPENGRAVTRALPMYWAESLRLRGAAATMCVVPMMRKTGPVTVGEPWPLPHMLATCPPEFQPDYVICGALRTGQRGARIELHLFRAADKQPLRTLRIPATGDFKNAAAAAERELLACLAPAGVVAGDNPSFATPKDLDAYVDCLGNLLLQTMVASGMMDAAELKGASAMLGSALKLAAGEPESPLPTLVVAAGIAAAVRSGAKAVVSEFRRPALDLLKTQSDRHDIIRRVAPVVHKLLGESGLLAEEIAALRPSAGEAYGQWLDALGV